MSALVERVGFHVYVRHTRTYSSPIVSPNPSYTRPEVAIVLTHKVIISHASSYNSTRLPPDPPMSLARIWRAPFPAESRLPATPSDTASATPPSKCHCVYDK